MLDVILSTLKQLAPYIALVAVGVGIFMAYKYFTKKPEVALSPQDSLSSPEAQPLLSEQGQQVQQMQQEKEPQMEHRIIGGIQEGDECPECNEKLVVSPFSKIVCNTCKVVYGLL
jgi:hypothetical protein